LRKKIRWTAFQKKYPSITKFFKSKGSPYQNFVYCSKDQNFEEFGNRPTEPKESHKKKPKDLTYDEALAADTVEEGINIVKTKRARDYCLHGESIERNLKKAKFVKHKSVYTIDQFNRPACNLNKSTLINGPSNCGKTHYACAHFKNPLVCSHIDNLRLLSPDNDGIIFDDMSFKHWPVESVIHLVDKEFIRTINVRYGTVTIPAGIQKIFTHNTDNPFYSEDTISGEQREAIERRVDRINVINKLY